MNNKVKKAIIPIGGLGTRFLPVTKVVAKELVPIVDIPTLQYIIEEVAASGIEEVVLISSYRKQEIEKYYEKDEYLEFRIKDKQELLDKLYSMNTNMKITFHYQDEPQGNGQAMLEAEQYIDDEYFAVLWGDDLIKSEIPVLKQLLDMYYQYGGNIIGVQNVPIKDVTKYGIVKFRDFQTKEIESIIEKPSIEDAPSTYAGLGRYIVSKKVFDELRSIHKEIGEYYFTDALSNLLKYQKSYACIFEGQYLDIGTQLGFIIANIEYGLEREDIKNSLLKYIREKFDR